MTDFLFTTPQGISAILQEFFHQIFYKQNICTRFLEPKNYHPIEIYNLLLFLHYMNLYIHLLIDYQIEHLFLFYYFSYIMYELIFLDRMSHIYLLN